jgi:hypothetical protein
MVLGWFRRVKDADVTVVLTDPERTVKCSQRFVDDLCHRVMNPALAELDRRFGKEWLVDIAPSLILEGPGLAFKLTVHQLRGWKLRDMGTVISEVFNENWEREVDRLPPPPPRGGKRRRR